MDEELDISDVNGICRLCLKDDCTIIPIFGRENTSRNGIPLSKKILDCVSVKVSDSDGMPSMICVGCVHQVDSWQGFKNNCDVSQNKLNSWLRKTNPEIYAKNEAEKVKEVISKVGSSDIIDLSSDDEEVYVAHRPVLRRSIINRKYKNQSISHFQNPELLIKTNEVEILPVQNVCINESENHSEHEDIPSPDSDLPDRLTGVTIPADDNFENDSPDNHNIWPDAETSDPLGSADPMAAESGSENAAITKDSTPKDLINNDSQGELSSEMIIPQCEKLNDAPNITEAEKMDITEPNVNGIDENTSLENTENNVILGEKSPDLIDNTDKAESQNPNTDDPKGDATVEDQENSSNPQPAEAITDGDNTDLLNKTPPSSETDENNPSATIKDISKNHENTASEKNSGNSDNLEHNENSVENSSSFVIEKVTSLNNQNEERMDVDTNSRDLLIEESAEKENSNENWGSQCQDDDSQDVEPDIILCDSITSVVGYTANSPEETGSDEHSNKESSFTHIIHSAHLIQFLQVSHIKEELLSANEAEEEEDEEDPLNFHSVLLKRESENFVDESEDVKPNVELLDEAMENQYTPKRLKNGKVHCEPCRVSFSNDVYYERHTKSLRHRMNFKLFRLGKGPTKARGKALINVAMGNIANYARGSGPYCCTQCPSRFKHMRNLHTHKKKHLIEVRVSSRKPPSETASQSSDFEITNLETNVKVREDLKCELCFQSFMSNPALVSHKRFCGVSEKQQCTHCGQSFTTQSLFVKHRKDCLKDFRRSIFNDQRYREEEMNSRMTPPPQTPPKPSTPMPVTVPLDGSVLACTLCNLTFKTSTDLINHMQQNHMDFGKVMNNPPPELPEFAKPNHFSRTRDSRLHYCKYCLRSFPTLGALSSHTGYHARKSAYCCKFCRQTFKDKIGFRQHIKVHIADPNLNKNVCWMCYTPFATQRDLINHKAVHANVKLKVFSCSTCGNSYNSKELLSKHRRASHMMPLVNPEDDLEMVPDNEPSYQQIEEDDKLFKCRICKKRFTTSGNLKRHSLKHKPGFVSNMGNFHTDYTVQHRCNWCFKGFKTQTGLLNHKPFCTRFRKTGLPHINNVHSGAIKCKDCKRWFASQNSLYKHRVLKRCRPILQPNERETVVPIRAQNCPNCDQQFLSEESLNRHKQNCKPSIERLTCDCGEVFGSVELKQSHAENCASNCTCKNCNMKFNSPEELESHQSICQIQSQNHTPTPSPFQLKTASYTPESRLPAVECAKCQKKFVYSKCLQIHEDKCLYDRWPCTNCLEIFPTETALATHKSHKTCQSPRHSRSSSVTSLSDGPTFKCESCPERFVSANELREHTVTCENRLSGIEPEGGSGDKPFKCDQCDKTFLWKVNVQRHRKLAHKHLYQSDTESTPIRKNPEREASTFRCKLCPDIVFHKQQGLLEHQRIHENQEDNETTEDNEISESGVLLTCELCDKKLPEALYPLHMDEHMNDDFEESQEIEAPPVECELGESYSCDICGKEFSTPQSRKSHRASHWRHYTTGYVPTLEPSLRKRYKAKHIRCNVCNKLLSINSLPKHKMMHRREAAEFYGGEDRNQTPQKATQSASASTSASRSSTPSLMVDLSFNQEEENEETSTSIFPCPKCDKTFKLRKLLLEHLKNHMDESPDPDGFSSAPGTVDQYPYKCVYCDLSWKYKSVFERHLSSKKHLEIQKQLSGII